MPSGMVLGGESWFSVVGPKPSPAALSRSDEAAPRVRDTQMYPAIIAKIPTSPKIDILCEKVPLEEAVSVRFFRVMFTEFLLKTVAV